jgi:hypothetical protein
MMTLKTCLSKFLCLDIFQIRKVSKIVFPNTIYSIMCLNISLCEIYRSLLRKLGHRPGGYGNVVEDYWPWLRRSLMAHPYSSWLSSIKALKLLKAVAGQEKE